MKRMTLLLLCTVASLPAAVHAQAKHDGAVPWACGGVSAEERRALPGVVPDANLELLFVGGKRGAYEAGAEWRIFDRSGEPVAFGTADGPQCFLRAPAGSLRVEARIGSEMHSAKATIKPGAKRSRLVFTFAGEPEEEGVQASEEEKRQARQP